MLKINECVRSSVQLIYFDNIDPAYGRNLNLPAKSFLYKRKVLPPDGRRLGPKEMFFSRSAKADLFLCRVQKTFLVNC